MSWETRGNNRYYYRRRKINGRVVADYIGAGYVAEAIAGLDKDERQERQRAAAEWRAIVEADRRQVATLNELDGLIRDAMAAVLLAHGYHAHKRQWRRQR